MRIYPYIGPRRIADRVASSPPGTPVHSPVDFARWANATGRTAEADGGVTVTYVVDGEGVLRIADRRSEHIACAGGRPVRSAGEMTLAAKGEHVAVLSVSNQSTGFCPEPERGRRSRRRCGGPVSHRPSVSARRACSGGVPSAVASTW